MKARRASNVEVVRAYDRALVKMPERVALGERWEGMVARMAGGLTVSEGGYCQGIPNWEHPRSQP